MFDASFKELLLILVLGLLVLGPERLPKVAAEVGKWVARARRTATQLRRQLEREIELDDAIQSRRERERREAAQKVSEDLSRSASGEMPPSGATAADGNPTIHASAPDTGATPTDAASPADSAASPADPASASAEDLSPRPAVAPAELTHPSETEPGTASTGSRQEETEAAPRVREEPPRV